MTDSGAFRLIAVELDEQTVVRRTREIEQEREIAIYDLLEGNHFNPVGSEGGPYRLVLGVAENARRMFEGTPGLRFKFFTFDEKQQRAQNFYVWESKEAAEAFFSEELRERVSGLYGVAPEIEFVEIAQIVDNSGS